MNRPELCQGLCLVTLSLRGLNIRKQPALIKPFVAALQRTLRETSLGVSFFGSVAKPRAVKNVLRQAYAGNPDAVTDELVEFILTPGLQPGAAAVFLEFISFCTLPAHTPSSAPSPWLNGGTPLQQAGRTEPAHVTRADAHHYARLPPGGVQGWQPGCPTRGAPPAAHREGSSTDCYYSSAPEWPLGDPWHVF